MDNEDKAVLAVLSGLTTAAATGLGSIAATITTTAPAWGPLGWIGLTTAVTSVVSLPVTGIAAAAGAVVWGGYKVYKVMNQDHS